MYIEFLLIVFDYFKTLKKKSVIVYEWFFPFILTIGCVYIADVKNTELFNSFKESSINVIGVLLGFSIAVITILTTGSGDNLDGIRRQETGITIKNRVIMLYDLLLINFTYSVVLEVVLIISCLTIPLMNQVFEFSFDVKLFFYSIMVFLVLHILLLNLRNITDFYLIVSRPINSNNSSNQT